MTKAASAAREPEGSTAPAPYTIDHSILGDYFADCYFCNKPDPPEHLHIQRVPQ